LASKRHVHLSFSYLLNQFEPKITCLATHKHYIIRSRSAKQKQTFLLLSLNHGFGTIDNPLSVSKVGIELLTDLVTQLLTKAQSNSTWTTSRWTMPSPSARYHPQEAALGAWRHRRPDRLLPEAL